VGKAGLGEAEVVEQVDQLLAADERWQAGAQRQR
jgi:hypothetical protein